MRNKAFHRLNDYFHNKYGISGKQIALSLERSQQIKGKKSALKI